MLDDIISEWKLRARVLSRMDNQIVDGMVYQLDKCIYELENEYPPEMKERNDRN
jgi:hypothetical protein